MAYSVSKALDEIQNKKRKAGAIVAVGSLPPATKRALQALIVADDYRLPHHEFRLACCVRSRFYGTLVHRLLDQSLIVRYKVGYALTWYGKRALDADSAKKEAAA